MLTSVLRKTGSPFSPTEKLEAVTWTKAGTAVAPSKVERRAEATVYGAEMCNECGNFTLVRNGTCMKCDRCGGTSRLTSCRMLCNAPQKGNYHPICLHDAPQLNVDTACN
jgi:hypothetical protein